MMISIKRAPNFLLLARSLQCAMFPLPVIMLFYQYKGATIGDFFLIQGIFSIVTFMLEAPSGYLGDLFSRKRIISLGLFFYLVGNFIWIMGNRFIGIVGGEIMFAISHSLCSGTIEAYLYDLLKKECKERQMHQKLGKMETYSGVSMAIATLSGGIIYYNISPEAVVWGNIITTSIAFIIALFLPDIPEFKRKIRDISKLKDIFKISKDAIKNHEIKWLIIYPAFFGICTLILMWGLQPVMISKELPAYIFGFVAGFNMVCRVGWSSLSSNLFNFLGLNGLIKMLLIVLFIGFGASIIVENISSNTIIYMLLCLMAISAGSQIILKIITTTLINHRIQSNERSTILSLKSMFSKLLSGIGLIVLKPLFDEIGVRDTFLISSTLIIVVSMISYHLIKMQVKTHPIT